MSNAKLALVVAALLPIAEALSGRERDILCLIAQGCVDKEIARALSISPATVKSHVGNIFTKLNVQKRAHAVSRAQQLGLIDPSSVL